MEGKYFENLRKISLVNNDDGSVKALRRCSTRSSKGCPLFLQDSLGLTTHQMPRNSADCGV
jgi:hypothetical protein